MDRLVVHKGRCPPDAFQCVAIPAVEAVHARHPAPPHLEVVGEGFLLAVSVKVQQVGRHVFGWGGTETGSKLLGRAKELPGSRGPPDHDPAELVKFANAANQSHVLAGTRGGETTAGAVVSPDIVCLSSKGCIYDLSLVRKRGGAGGRPGGDSGEWRRGQLGRCRRRCRGRSGSGSMGWSGRCRTCRCRSGCFRGRYGEGRFRALGRSASGEHQCDGQCAQ